MYKPTNLSQDHSKFLKKHSTQKKAIGLSRVIILIFIFAIWEIAAYYQWIDPFIMSQPSRMIKTAINLSKDGSIFMHTGVTIYETIVGFVLGTVLGTIIALALWWSEFLA